MLLSIDSIASSSLATMAFWVASGGRGICISLSLVIANFGIATALVANHACFAKEDVFVKYKMYLLFILSLSL